MSASSPPTAQALTERYRPAALAEVLGQSAVCANLRRFAAAPYPAAFLFHGETGVGKTSAARALAADLGCVITQGPFGGLDEIASGEQTGDAVRALADTLRMAPMVGSGWRVAVINEADYMSPSAAQIWLDVLEAIPSRTVIVFTTNKVDRLPTRFRDRCEEVRFESDPAYLHADMGRLVARVWREAGRTDPAPTLLQLAVTDATGQTSFRRCLQRLAQVIRTGVLPPAPVAGPPAPVPAAGAPRSAAALKAWATRRARAQARKAS